MISQMVVFVFKSSLMLTMRIKVGIICETINYYYFYFNSIDANFSNTTSGLFRTALQQVCAFHDTTFRILITVRVISTSLQFEIVRISAVKIWKQILPLHFLFTSTSLKWQNKSYFWIIRYCGIRCFFFRQL